MTRSITVALALLAGCAFASGTAQADDPPQVAKEFKVYPIGYVRKVDGRTTVVLDIKS